MGTDRRPPREHEQPGQWVDDFWFDSVDPDGTPHTGIQAQLKAWEIDPPAIDWAQAVAAFRTALAAATAAQHVRGLCHGALVAIGSAERRVSEAQDRARKADAAWRAAQHDQADGPGLIAARHAERERFLAGRTEHRSFRPSLAQALFGRGTMKAWQARDDQMRRDVETADESLAAAQRHHAACAAVAQATERRALQAVVDLACEQESLAEATAALAKARRGGEGVLPDQAWWDDPVQRELVAPWVDEAWNATRTEVFLAALRLHKAFLSCVPRQMRQSLHGAVDILKGDAPDDLSEAKAREAWHALFFVVPVVSTTFASLGRLFPQHGPGSLGWVLIDEAGQATPQAAAGAIWRARRAVVVGDPLQLEPVFTLPGYAQRTLLAHAGTHERWLPAISSAQSLADRITPYGMSIGQGDDALWVGAPLRVHRRCDEPMFTISNTVAYEGLMISAVCRSGPLFYPGADRALPESAWIHLAGGKKMGHWLVEEGDRLQLLLAELTSRGCPPAEIFAISPFRQVARRLEETARRPEHRGMTAGTIHRSQGKEADVVILVLGGDPASPGARRWAAEKPNMVNVAVSRARRRLYVIGNRTLWSEQPHFDVLAGHLPLWRADQEIRPLT